MQAKNEMWIKRHGANIQRMQIKDLDFSYFNQIVFSSFISMQAL